MKIDGPIVEKDYIISRTQNVRNENITNELIKEAAIEETETNCRSP